MELPTLLNKNRRAISFYIGELLDWGLKHAYTTRFQFCVSVSFVPQDCYLAFPSVLEDESGLAFSCD
jgi:hypothetical protein